MRIRPYHVWILLAAMIALSARNLSQRPRAEYALSSRRVAGWASLTRFTPEELDRGVAHRYVGLAAELNEARDVGYFSEMDRSDLWAMASNPSGFDRIQRYYMAQSILAPALLRLDETRPLVVVDCATPEQAEVVRAREGLVVIRDHGRGLLLARPGP